MKTSLHLSCIFLALAVVSPISAQYEHCAFPQEVQEALFWIDQPGKTNYDSAFQILQSYQEHAAGLADTCHALLLHRMGLSRTDNEQRIDLYQRAYSFYTRQKPTYAAFSIRLLNNIAGRYNTLGGRYRLDSFPVYIERAMQAELSRSVHDLPFSDQYPRTCHWYGRYQKDLGNHKHALQYYLEAIINYPKYPETTDLNNKLAGVYNDLSGLYTLHLGQPDEGRLAAEEGLAISGIRSITKSNLHFNFALAYDLKAEKSSSGAARLYYQTSLETYQMILNQNKELIDQALNNIGVLLIKTGKYAAALDTLQKVIAINQGLDDLLARNYDNLGDAYLGMAQEQRALTAYTQAIKNSFFDYDSNEPFDLPDLEKNRALDKIGALESLRSRASALTIHYEKNPVKIDYLKAALEHYRFIDQFLDILRQEPYDESSKLKLAAQIKPIYEDAIKSCLLMKKAKNEGECSRYDGLAWYYAERSKAIALLKWLNARNAAQATLPEVQAQQLFDLIRKKEAAQSAYDIAIIDQDPEEQELWLKNLTAYSSALDQHQAGLLKQHPAYQKLIQEDYHPPSLDYIRAKILGKDAAIVEYFLGQEQSYAFLIDQDCIRTVSLTKTNVSPQIRQIRSSMERWSAGLARPVKQAILDSFILSSNELYNWLILPLGDIPQELIIVPDDELLYLPFEVLLTELPTTGTPVTEYHFWINKKTISYNYSIALLQQMVEGRNQRRATRTWGSFAPEFPSEKHWVGKKLGNLKYSADEAIRIAEHFQEKPFHQEAANTDNFYEHAGKYRYLLLATHGLINENDSNLIQLVLWDTSIFMKDLYTQHLNADLVILNACQTHIGKLYKGAGMASMNRGFVSAGVGSVLSTLWSIGDFYTPDFMKLFTDNILAAEPKNEALCNAKRRLIQQSGDSEPFLWASYVLYGDVIPVKKKMTTNYFWLLLPALLLLIFFRQRK